MPQFVNLFPKLVDRTIDPSGGAKNLDLTGAAGLETVRVADVKLQQRSRLVVHTDPRGPSADRFRYLRMRLRDPWEAGKLRTVLITSASPRDGKSTVALNLASSLCEHGGKRVLLIEADLHRPCLESLLGLENEHGLVECLETGENPMPFIRRLQPLGWCLLAAGGDCHNPRELLQSGAFSELLNKLAPHFDWILVDSPPVIPVMDALSVAREVDAILMVVRAGSTPRHAVEQSLSLLGRKKLLAVVLNGIEGLNKLHSKYGYYRNGLTDGGPS